MSTTLGNIDREVFLNGIDITRWVVSLPTLPNQKPDWGQIPSLPLLNITVRSDNFEFHTIHPASFMFQKRLDELSLVVKQQGLVVWSGFLQDAHSDFTRKQATLIGESSIQQQINRSARIDTDLATPARVARNLLVLHNVAVDEISFSVADRILDDIPVRVRVNPSVLEWTGTLGDLLQLLASAGIGRFYLNQQGAIGFDTYILDETPLQSFEINDDITRQWPKITDESMEAMNGFTVKYLHGTEREAGTNEISSMDFGSESSVQIATRAAAAYIGSQWVALSERLYNRVEIAIQKNFNLVVKLGTFIRLNSFLMGLDRTMEVIGIDDGDPRWVKITGRIDKGIV